ncbi:hypothetical protein FA95DRAFT_249676 [Auriscalpium vulgare]|uniref:Uncharacterized protein n=1 Tax=Auriscalpium vulgare TaxID=40419 RepID=A0ACB8RK33_9AGAM|nr:hypothetical protein FA95DRAFT_249676 [Auriscalpium vulgare]
MTRQEESTAIQAQSMKWEAAYRQVRSEYNEQVRTVHARDSQIQALQATVMQLNLLISRLVPTFDQDAEVSA